MVNYLVVIIRTNIIFLDIMEELYIKNKKFIPIHLCSNVKY